MTKKSEPLILQQADDPRGGILYADLSDDSDWLRLNSKLMQKEGEAKGLTVYVSGTRTLIEGCKGGLEIVETGCSAVW